MYYHKLIIATLISLIKYVSCDCGPPGSPVGAKIIGHDSIVQEGHVVSYECEKVFGQVYDKSRTCIRGKWSTRIPKCALDISSKLVIGKYKITYLDMDSENFEVSIGDTFEDTFGDFDQSYIWFNESKNVNFEVFYSPVSRISYTELLISIKYKNETIDAEDDLIVRALINKYRNCIISNKYWTSPKLIEYDIICELKSFESFNNETGDMPNSIQFSFESEMNFKLKVEGITVYRFQDDCGTPDTPLHARYEKRGNTVYYYPLNDKKYRIVGENTIKCLFEGNWDKDIPALKPIIQCSTQKLDLNSTYFKDVEFENLEYFNETEVAVIDSRVKYSCFDYENSSQMFILVCNENGSWIGDQNKCLNSDQTNQTSVADLNNKLNKSNLFPIIITFLSTFAATLIITTILVAITIWRRKKIKKSQKRNKTMSHAFDENYDDINNEYVINDYEKVDYQTVDYEDKEYDKLNYEEMKFKENNQEHHEYLDLSQIN